MSFFGRLTNLGKGWVSSLGKKSDTTIVDGELQADRLNPQPGAEAQAELAALKVGAGKPSSAIESPASQPGLDAQEDSSEETEETAADSAPAVQKTL